jgi:hypothetical protein
MPDTYDAAFLIYGTAGRQLNSAQLISPSPGVYVLWILIDDVEELP